MRHGPQNRFSTLSFLQIRLKEKEVDFVGGNLKRAIAENQSVCLGLREINLRKQGSLLIVSRDDLSSPAIFFKRGPKKSWKPGTYIHCAENTSPRAVLSAICQLPDARSWQIRFECLYIAIRVSSARAHPLLTIFRSEDQALHIFHPAVSRRRRGQRRARVGKPRYT